jgi:beta-galactosidase/beta-glucuronidase
METQTTVEYEITVPETNKSFFTYSREEALDHYDEGCMVFEGHETITTPSVNTQTRVYVTFRWNNNPEFEEE